MATETGMEAVKRLVELKQQISELEGKVRVWKEEADGLEPAVVSWFLQNGVQNTRVDGATVYLDRSIKSAPRCDVPADATEDVKKSIREQAKQALIDVLAKAKKLALRNSAGEVVVKNADASFLVERTYNWQRLNAWVKELPRNTDGSPIIPAALAGVLSVATEPEVRVRKS